MEKTKEFITARLREYETKLHESDSKVINLVNDGIVMKQKIKDLEESHEVDQKELGFKEKQVKLLSNELKMNRNKIENSKNEMKNLLESCLDVKLLFERLDLNI